MREKNQPVLLQARDFLRDPTSKIFGPERIGLFSALILAKTGPVETEPSSFLISRSWVTEVAALRVIRHWALRWRLSIRGMARHADLSRNRAKEHLRPGEEMLCSAQRTSPGQLDRPAEKLAICLSPSETPEIQQQGHQSGNSLGAATGDHSVLLSSAVESISHFESIHDGGIPQFMID